MKKAVSLLLMIVLLATGVACQPTPDEEYIAHRDAELIEEKMQAGSPAPLDQTPEPEAAASYKEMVEAYKASLPQHWNDTIESNIVDFVIDADIEVSKTDSFPVYKIGHEKYDMEKMESIANRFFQNVTGIREGYKYLHDEYAAAITSLNERGMTEYAQGIFSEMQKAPDGSYTDADHITLETGYEKYVVRFGDDERGQIWFSQSPTMSYMYYDTCLFSAVHSQDDLKYDGSYDGEGKVILNPSISQEQGEEMVNAFMQENELEGFTVAAVTSARHFAFLTREEISQGWYFTLMRTYGYYAINTSETSQGDGFFRFEEDESYSRPWIRETVCLYVSENGVESFEWNYPMEVVGIASENAELLEFEQIQKNIKNMLTASIAWMESEHWNVKISKIALTILAQQVKNEPDYAYLMPTWVIIVDWYWDDDYESTTMLAVNALDGSRAVMHGEW